MGDETKQTWEEWITEHGRQVVEYVMVCLEDAKELWYRATKAEKERDEAQKKLGFATARIAELEAAQAKPTLEITDEMVEEMAKALRAHETKAPWVQAGPSVQAYWRGLARAAMEAAKDQLVGACQECAEKAKHIVELELDALATETEMSQARRRIKALEAVLRENRKWCEQGRYWGPMGIMDKHLKAHHITLPDPEEEAEPAPQPEPVDRVPLPDYLDPSTDDWAALVCTINAIINYLADRERADAQTGAVGFNGGGLTP